MTVTAKDGLYAFGSLETVEVPSGGPGLANDAVAKAPVGILYRHQGAIYRYVKVDASDVATAAGAVGYWLTAGLDPANGVFKVTADISDAIASGVNMVAGVFGAVITDQYYTWIQVGGVVTALTAASTVAGDMVCYGTDSTFGRMAAGSQVNVNYGVALGARNGTTGTNSVLLQNLAW
ncbi:MAG: hypothetical protein HQL37_11385 [Alphaproteobacteria bacterium]|nr:hypothetical protein [Alphaproteobacteria bacterium]